jgi:starvation-inducible outer membrane lipoprotein
LRHFTPFLIAPALLLAGCHTPEQIRAEEQSSQSTAAAAEPLVARCQAEFTKSLGGLAVTSLGGPSVTNFGDAIVVRLEAQPVDPNIIDAKVYSCDFENGEMTQHGPA